MGWRQCPVKGEILATAVASQPLDIYTAVALEIMEKETRLTNGAEASYIGE